LAAEDVPSHHIDATLTSVLAHDVGPAFRINFDRIEPIVAGFLGQPAAAEPLEQRF
jgi:hypothetical protein